MSNIIKRQAYLEQLSRWRDQEIIKVVTGVRRCGKSTLLNLYIEQLKAEGVADEQIVYVHLDDQDYSELLDYKKLHKYIKARILADKWTYVFIDEVQECNEYERALSSLYLKPKVDIYITGSNAHLLSGELATKLTGRYVEIGILPLSFTEYREAVDIARKETAVGKLSFFDVVDYREAVDISDSRERFSQYVNLGGFPYAARFIDNSLAHSQYLDGIYNTVLIKDVMARKKLTDVTLLKSIAAFLSSNIGSPVSAKKIADTLASGGRPTGTATVDTYLEALTESYLFYRVQRYDIKGKMHLKSEGKYYICDTGLRNMILGTTNKDVGHQIENIVFLELLHRGYTVNIGKSGRGTEIDFVATRNKQTEYYQISASVLDENTLERELTPLENIRDNYPKYLITLDAFSGDHNGIDQINLIEWLQKPK